MSGVEFRSQEYLAGNNDKVICLVAGFAGKIADFENAAQTLAAHNYNVVAYEYTNDVYLSGDAELLPALIKDISTDFHEKTKDHDEHRYAGASLGGGIAWNLQKCTPDTPPGLYAGIGADVANSLLYNKAFRHVVRYYHHIDPAKEFRLKGYDYESLHAKWAELEEPPVTGFAVALGGLDYIIRQREVVPKFEAWSKTIPIDILTLKWHDHTYLIRWFDKNIGTMLKRADTIKLHDAK